MKSVNELQREYDAQANARKGKIRQEPSKWKRFWKWVWYLMSFPFVWLFYNIRDWRSAVCIAVSFTLWSASVWGFYLAAAICGWTSTDAGKWLIGIGSAVWAWWVSPIGSPFILLVTFTAIGMKAAFNRMKGKDYEEE